MCFGQFGFCCCCGAGIFDWYDDYHLTVEGNETAGTPYIPRVASIYKETTGPLAFPDSSYPDWYVEIPNTGIGRNFQSKVIVSSIAPKGINSSEKVYMRLFDSGFKHHNKKWVFDSTTESLTEVGDAANVAMSWNSSGNPSGSIAFSSVGTTKNYTQTEKARTSGSPEKTWRSWGVPDNATVTDVQITSFQRRVAAATDKLQSHTLSARVLDTSNVAVLTGDLLNAVSIPTTQEGSFQAMGGGTKRQVLEDFTSPFTEVRFELEYALTLNNNSGDPGEETLFDNIIMEISYTTVSFIGYVQVDCVAKAVDWYVLDADWLAHEPPWPPMPQVSLSPQWGPAGGVPEYNQFSFNLPTSGDGAYTTGLAFWAQQGEFAASFYAIRLWTINELGEFSYKEYLDAQENWVNDNPDMNEGAGPYPYQIPQYSYPGGDVFFGPGESNPSQPYDHQMFVESFLENALLLGMAQNSQLGIGIRYPHFSEGTFDLWNDGIGGYWENEEAAAFQWMNHITFDASAEVHVGDLVVDEYGFTDVRDKVIWSKSWPDYHDSVNTIGTMAPLMRIDQFDAIRVGPGTSGIKSIAIVTYLEDTDFRLVGEFWYTDESKCHTVLCVENGDLKEEKSIFVASNLFDGPVIYVDEGRDRLYYPRWVSPRVLQPSSGQGGGQRYIVFARVPFDKSQASSYDGSDTQWQYRLKCYKGVNEEYDMVSRWAMGPSANGIVETNTANGATFHVIAHESGDAPVVYGNGNINVEIIADDPVEKAIYRSSSRTIEVQIDISGGHDQVVDLRKVIDDGGDFVTNPVSFDDDTITLSTTGDGELTGGSWGTPSVQFSLPPAVHSSSDRFYYVTNFRMRTPDFPRRYYDFWQISHDGSILNPTGIGPRDNRGPIHFQGGFGDYGFDCVKNSGLLPLTPPLEIT